MATVRPPPVSGQASSGAHPWTRDRVLYPKPGIDLMSAGLSPQEGWVLSRLDGKTSYGELCLITGLGEAQTITILQRLLERGLILLERPRPGENTAAPSTASNGSTGKTVSPIAAVSEPASAPLPPPPLAPPPLVTPPVNATSTMAPSSSASSIAEKRTALEATIARLKRELADAEATMAALAKSTSAPTTDTSPAILSSPQTFAPKAVTSHQQADVIASAPTVEVPSLSSVPVAPAVSSVVATPAPATSVGASKEGSVAVTGTAAAKSELDDLLKDYAQEVAPPASTADAQPSSATASAVGSAKPTGKAGPKSTSIAPASESVAEPQELSSESKALIFRKYQRLQTDDLFELLEVSADADKRDIKRSYFRLSKEYHPDRYFGRALGPHKEHLSEIFKALSQAMEYLEDDARRSEYRAMILRQREMQQLERSLELAVEAALDEEKRMAGQRPNEAESRPAGASMEPRTGPPVLPPSSTKTGGSDVATTRSLAPGSSASQSGKTSTPAPTVPASHAQPRRLLRQMLAQRMGDQKTTRARQYFDEGIKHLDRKDYVQAASSLKLATTLAPENIEYRTRFREADGHATMLQGGNQFERGNFEERAGRLGVAAEYYAKAADRAATTNVAAGAVGKATTAGSTKTPAPSSGTSKNSGTQAPASPPSSEASATAEAAADWANQAAMKAAALFLKTRQLERAERYGIMATERAPNSASAHFLLGQVLRERRQGPDAMREFERALAIDKGHAEARAALKEMMDGGGQHT